MFELSHRHPMRMILGAGLALAVVLPACSKDAGLAVESRIEEMEPEIGLGSLDPECDVPEEYAQGDTFTCIATADGGQVVEFDGEMTDDDTYTLFTSNLLVASDIVSVREQGARVLSDEIGVEIDPDDIDCDEVVVLDDSGDFVCAITEPSTGNVYDLTVSTGGIEPGVGVRKLAFQVADAAR